MRCYGGQRQEPIVNRVKGFGIPVSAHPRGDEVQSGMAEFTLQSSVVHESSGDYSWDIQCVEVPSAETERAPLSITFRICCPVYDTFSAREVSAWAVSTGMRFVLNVYEGVFSKQIRSHRPVGVADLNLPALLEQRAEGLPCLVKRPNGAEFGVFAVRCTVNITAVRPSSPTPTSSSIALPATRSPIWALVTDGVRTAVLDRQGAETARVGIVVGQSQIRLKEQDFLHVKRLQIVNGSSRGSVLAYSPEVFAYISSLVPGGDLVEEWSIPPGLERGELGAGRSGSFFVKSKGRRYFLKTITKAEADALRSALPAYVAHLVKDPSSLIMKIYALLKFESTEANYYSIVFNNIGWERHPAGPPTIFDLKGRVAKKGKAVVRRHEDVDVWKDKDLERFFFLRTAARNELVRRMERDTAFLCENNFMDYSLLVIARKPTEQEWARSEVEGGFLSAGVVREVYRVGIIDCLTLYGKKKRFANAAKHVFWRNAELSTVPAPEYKARFMSYMEKIFASEDPVSPVVHPNHREMAQRKLPIYIPSPIEPLGELSMRSTPVDAARMPIDSFSVSHAVFV